MQGFAGDNTTAQSEWSQRTNSPRGSHSPSGRRRTWIPVLLVFLLFGTEVGASCIGFHWVLPAASETGIRVAVVTQPFGSVPASLRFLGIGYDAFGAGNIASLDIALYQVVVFDYGVGKPGEGYQPALDVSQWLQTHSEQMTLWLMNGGALIDCSEGEAFVLDALLAKRAPTSDPLASVTLQDSLFTTPNVIGQNLTEQVYVDLYVAGGSELALYDAKANGTSGPALLARNAGKGRVYLSALPGDRSIVRRGLLENMLQEASKGTIKGSPFQITDTGTENLRIRFPYFAGSILALKEGFEAAVLNISTLAGMSLQGQGSLPVDFTRDLDWETGSAKAVSAGSTLFIDVWQLPELMGTESSLTSVFQREIGRMFLGWTGIMGASHVESMAQLAEVYCLNQSADQAGHDLVQRYTDIWQQFVSGNDSRIDIDASEMTGMSLGLVQTYGWDLITSLCAQLDRAADYGHIAWNNRLSLLIHYSSIMADADLLRQFQDWGFQVNRLQDIDTSPPTVALVTPANPERVFVNIQKFEAALADDLVVNASSVRVFLNDVEVTTNCSVSPVQMVYSPSAMLPEGQNSLKISLFDIAGKPYNWTLHFEASSRCSLLILSEHGNVAGAGVYGLGETAQFNLTSTVAQDSAAVRHVFVQWTSDTPDGYKGKDTSHSIVMRGNVTQIVEWKTQYLLTMQSSPGGVITPATGWQDSGSIVNITAKAQKGYAFVQWVGEGVASYTGMDANHTLIIEGPISQRASFWDNELPVAKAGKNQTVEVGRPVTLDASGSTDNVGITRYEWDLGDGSIGNMPFMTYTYGKIGVYRVTLKVSDGSGNSATETVTITVKEVALPPPDGPSLPSWVTTYGPWIALIAIAALLLGLMPFLITKATG